MLYTKTGITQRVRTDLTGPDGHPGIDISGYTMKNMYEEMSKGAYTVDGAATEWVTVPHSEAWYGAFGLHPRDGKWTAGVIQSMNGHPDNPDGAGAPRQGRGECARCRRADFPWTDYDIEDQGDIDNDGDLLEPDGIVDHLVLVHAGEDKSGGGGAQGVYSIWAHSSSTRDTPSPARTSRSPTTSSSPKTPASVSSRTSTAMTWASRTCTTRPAPVSPRVDFWDLMSTGRTAVRSSSRFRSTWACGTSGCSAGPTR